MPIHEPAEINSRLLALARLQQETDKALEPINAQLAALTAEKRRLEGDLEATETVLRTDLLNYMQETGDLHAHPLVTFRRTKKLVYDKAEVLAMLKQEGVTDFIRVREELDVRAFEKAFRDGELQWLNVEEVNAPTLELHRLGELLILNQLVQTEGQP